MPRLVTDDGVRLRRSLPRVLIVAGTGLLLAGFLGTLSACPAGAEPVDLLTATVSGLAVALGAVALLLGAGRRGYHARPLGSPPGDMDPSKAHGAPPDLPK
jgi:hypothetical protein